MLSLQHYQDRRSQFLKLIQKPVLLMAGGERSRNYPDQVYPYRADSNFMYFFGQPEPNSAAIFDPHSGKVTLYLQERTTAGALWHGAVPDFAAMQETHGVDRVASLQQLQQDAKALRGKNLETIAVPDHRATATALELTGEELDFDNAAAIGNADLIQAIGNMRARKTDAEVAQMRLTAAVTEEAHVSAMANTKAGILEQELVGHVHGVFSRHGCQEAYNCILSVRGEVLHNHSHDQVLQDTDIVLLDAGAENASGYCSDVTRCWPVSGKFSPQAADIYDIVLAAEVAAIELVKPGVRYRDLHMCASRVIAQGLADMGILKGNADSLVESGAHALFFPHGVGHIIGLDVHDMEGFGDAIAYPNGRQRSPQFGTGYLRLDMDLEPGISFTVEPGIYFVPAILQSDDFRQQFKEQVDFAKAETFLQMNGRGFGGIRIEDDVLCTATGYEVMTQSTPKQRQEVEDLVGSAL